MARIRTIKPEFWTDEKVLGINPMARLLFIGMWNFADDYGRMEYSPISLKARIFPGDSISADDVREMLAQLKAAKLLVIYSSDEKNFIEITGWHNQKIDKRQSSKIPSPSSNTLDEADSTPTPADSRRLSPTPADGMEWNGMEGKGEESNSVADATVAVATMDDPAIPEREYFFRGREVLGKGAGGLIAELLKAKGRNVALARAALETASTKQNPTEYVAAICRGGKNGNATSNYRPDPVAGRATAREAQHVTSVGDAALQYLRKSKSAGSGRETSRDFGVASVAYADN